MRDWRDPDDYAFTKDLKPWQWAWQFLRRNPDYRADFAVVLERFNAREDDYSRRFSKRLAPGEEPESIPNAECRRKWFVWYYLNPKIEFPTADPFVEFVDLYMSNTHLWPLEPHEAIVRLDLELPITPQLKLAKRVLERRQQALAGRGEIEIRTPRNYRPKWQLYLRLLDGSQAGVPYGELASLLPAPRPSTDPNPEARVDAHLQQARRMARVGYRDLLLTS